MEQQDLPVLDRTKVEAVQAQVYARILRENQTFASMAGRKLLRSIYDRLVDMVDAVSAVAGLPDVIFPPVSERMITFDALREVALRFETFNAAILDAETQGVMGKEDYDFDVDYLATKDGVDALERQLVDLINDEDLLLFLVNPQPSTPTM